jgi:predicted dehydrogenase
VNVLAVVGCGNIGSRTLQALAKLTSPATIFAVDPVPAALARARERVAELGPAARAKVVYAESMQALPGSIDLAIVATCADTRRATVEALLDRAEVHALVLEKFLFQRREDYAAVGARIAKSGARCWVNLVRRAWPGYQALRRRLAGDRRVEMQALGPDFRLASNAVHYIDIYAFLTGVHVSALDGSGIDPEPMASRRAEFRELSGVLRGHGAEGRRVTLASHRGGKLPFVIQFFTPDLHWIVRELERKAWCASAETDWTWRETDFPTLDMSAMTDAYAEILEHGRSMLPAYDESAEDHLNLLAVYNRHWFGAKAGEAACPIT